MIQAKKLVPLFIRDRLRFLKKPRLSLLRFLLRLTAQEKVMQGPFTGMKFCVPDYNTAMLSGTWEKELWETLDDFLAIDPKRILCIGAAEGYYAVGLGIRFPNCRIIAFEQQRKYQIMLGRLSIENDLSNLQLQGKCTPNTLQQTLGANLDSSIVICDVEGYEIELLDPSNIKSLSKSYILVELHPMYVENCESIILNRFTQSHEISKIKGRVRTLDDLPTRAVSFLSLLFGKETILSLMEEGRPYPMDWLWMRPKNDAC